MNATTRDEPGVQNRKVLLRITQVGFPIAVLVAVFGFAVPKFARYASVWAVLQGLTWPELVVSLPGLTLAQAAVNNQTTTSIANTVPGGGVVAIGVSYVMLRSWGFTTAEVTLSTLVTGIWNSFGKLAMPIFAVAVLTLTGGTRVALFLPALAGVAVLVAAVVVFGLLMWKKAFAHRIGVALGCCASWLRRPLGKAPVSGWDEVLGIFSLGRLLTAAPITPGGVGVVELTYITGLVLAGGGQIRAQAVAT